MSMPGAISVAELDPGASTDRVPYAIITADCSNPFEIDDGIFVKPLDTDSETYQVGVCVADTSNLYDNGEIRAMAMEKTKARYFDLPDGERGYDPMLPIDAIRDLEFAAGKTRGALVVSFLVGKDLPPSEVEAVFGNVEVVRNIDYKTLFNRSLGNMDERRFKRASELIRYHLQYVSGGDYDTAPAGTRAHKCKQTEDESRWTRGARMNEAYMVAASHLVGGLLDKEDRPAIYRVHDPEDESLLAVMAPNVASYSWTPGMHSGLNLDLFCRVTSPLRRLEDFMMSYQLRRRAEGRAPSYRDARDIAIAVRRLNQQIILGAADPTQLSAREVLGRAADGFRRPRRVGAQVLAFPEQREAAG